MELLAIPLMQCLVGGNRTQTLPSSFGGSQGAVADSCKGTGNGSRLYELNTWMRSYGSGQPRRVTVAEAEQQRKASVANASERAAEALKRRREEQGADYYSSR